MSKEQEILQRLQRMQRAPIVPCIPVKVKSVEDDNTCTVIFPDGFEQSEVRLKAGIDDSKEFFVIKPRPKSTVLVSPLGDETEGNYVVVSVNEIDSLELIFSDEDKVSIKADKKACKITNDTNVLEVSKERIMIQTEGTLSIFDKEQVSIESKVPMRLVAETDLKEVLNAINDAIRFMAIQTGSAGSISPVAPVHKQFTDKVALLIGKFTTS